MYRERFDVKGAGESSVGITQCNDAGTMLTDNLKILA